MKDFNKIIKIIFIILILIVVAIISIIKLLEYKKQLENQVDIKDSVMEEEKSISEKNDYQLIYTCIEKYLIYSRLNNTEKLDSILEESDNNRIKIDDTYFLKILSLYGIDRYGDSTYFVETKINNNKLYFLLNVDFSGDITFNIRLIDKEEFDDAKANKFKDKYKKEIKIANNGNNLVGKYGNASAKEIANKYYSKFMELALYKPELAFDMINEEYKNKKFDNNIETFKKYILISQEFFENSFIKEVNVVNVNDNVIYKAKDNGNNNIKIKENKYMDFEIILDNYTLQDQDDIDEYLNLSDEEKIQYNIEKVFVMLSHREYSLVYNILDETFKANNFPNLNDFIKYVDNTFFIDNYMANTIIQKQGNNYVIDVSYKNGTSSVAEAKEKSFVMKLLDNTDFVMSFSKD